DWADGGWNGDESVQLTQLLKTMDVEVIDVSTGGAVHHQEIPVEPNYQVPFANRIKQETEVITGAVGLINSGQQAEEILQNQEADFVLIGRGFLRNPHLVYEFAKELNFDLDWPPSCLEVILRLMLSRTTEETTHGNINRKKQTKQEQSISRNETSRKRNITKQLRKVVRLIAKRCVNTVVRLGQDRINMKENA